MVNVQNTETNIVHLEILSDKITSANLISRLESVFNSIIINILNLANNYLIQNKGD